MSFASWPPTPPSSGSGTGNDLATTGDPVDVSGAAPPVEGQVLTATDPTHAVWRVPGLKYDAAIRFNVDAGASATIEPGTWGFVYSYPGGTAAISIFVVSSLAAPPTDSRFGLYVSPSVAVPVTVSLVGASQIMNLDGTLGTTATLLPGAMYEWVFYHEGGVAIWGLVSDTTHVARALRSSAAPNAPVIITGAAPTSGQALIATDATHASWTTPAAASSLATTGGAVDVASAAPPIAGRVLTAIDATHAQWSASSAARAFPYLEPHPAQHTSSDEFDSGSPDLAVRGWSVRNITDGVTCTRGGTINPLNFNAGSVATNTYNSKIVGSTLLLQFPCDGKVYAITKPFTPNANGGYVWGRVTANVVKSDTSGDLESTHTEVGVFGNSGGVPITTHQAACVQGQRTGYTQYYLTTTASGTATSKPLNTTLGGAFAAQSAGMIYPIRGIKYDAIANRKVNAILLTDQGDQACIFGTPATAATNVPIFSNIGHMGVLISNNVNNTALQPLHSLDFIRVLDGITDWIVT